VRTHLLHHRRALEVFLAHRFPTLIVRLPGLFGPGLKKNVLYDLLHNNGVDRVQPDSQFQFYGLDHLWSDVTLAMKCQIPVLHAATAPLTVAEIAHRCFGRDLPKAMEPSPVRYDFRSGFCELFGGSNGYLYGREEVLAEIKRFVATNREARYATSGV